MRIAKLIYCFPFNFHRRPILYMYVSVLWAFRCYNNIRWDDGGK